MSQLSNSLEKNYDKRETIVKSSQQQECQDGNLGYKENNYQLFLAELKAVGSQSRSDIDQPSLSTKPVWFDEKLFGNAKTIYSKHFMAVSFAHLAGLLLLVRINSIFKTLQVTGKSDSVSKLFNRYYQTIVHVKKWYEGDIFEQDSDAHSSLLIVRGMHNKVSSRLNDLDSKTGEIKEKEQTQLADYETQPVPKPDHRQNARDNNNSARSVHISEYDIMITQFAFVGFIVLCAKNVGLIDSFDEYDLKSLLHFWRVIGYYLGVSEKLNLCSRDLEDIRGLCVAIAESEYKPAMAANPISSPPGIMSVNIIRSVRFIPLLTIYGMLKYLYEILRMDSSELESKSTRFSRLSYTIIKWVMTSLLGYKVLRMFNNGLTRLSLHLVGKFQKRFASNLENKYGNELKTI